MATLYDKIRTQHTTGLDTEIKDYLPIIGNEIPNKLITNFDETEAVTVITDTGVVAGACDYKKSYHGNACYKLSVENAGAGGQGRVQINFATAINLTQLSESSNNYAEIKQTGKYGNDEDKLFLILNAMVNPPGGKFSNRIAPRVYNGTKYAEAQGSYRAEYSGTPAGINIDEWQKVSWEMNNTTFSYNNGFLDADWENVTKIEFICFVPGTTTVPFYFQNFWCALPPYNLNQDFAAHIVANSYYPDVNETNSIFVSWLFGDDANTGQGREIPVKTIDDAITKSNAIAGRDYVVILDSETYKPITNYTDVGIKQTLTDDVILIADYLETPVLSIAPGSLNKNRIGSREYYRTHWYENDGGVGTKIYVDSTGVYPASVLTITAAIAASAAGDCIEIVDDSAVYDEAGAIAIPHDLTFQAAPKIKPIWKCSAANTTASVANADTIRFYGIIFEGNNGAAAEQRIDINHADADIKTIDCTFKEIGGDANNGDAIETNALTVVENCLFIDNGNNFKSIEKDVNTTGLLYTINNLIYLKNLATNYFVTAGRASAAGLNTFMIYNEFYADNSATPACFIKYSDGAGTVNPTNFYVFLNIIHNGEIYVDYANNQRGNEIFIKNNKICQYAIFGMYFRDLPASASVLKVEGNLFVPIGTVALTRVICISNVTGNFTFSFDKNIIWGDDSNKFYHGLYINNMSTITFASCDNNIFYKISHRAVDVLSNINATFNNNIYLFNGDGIICAGVITDNYGIYYGNTNDVGPNVVRNNNSSENPEFIDADNINFGWYFDSVLETRNEWIGFLGSLFYPTITAAETLGIKFIETEGYYGKSCFDTNDVEITLQYCNIKDFVLGINSVGEKINVLNSYFENNSIAARINNSTITEIIDCKNNIFYKNNTAIILKSGIDFDYNTVLESDYGLYGIFTGFYSLDEYISDYVIIQNSIIYESSVYDYYYTLPTNYCIIGSRYYDELASTDINYKVTKGANDYAEKPWLTDNYFPATLYEGYLFNSIAYLNDSLGTGHIGARNENHIKAVFIFTAYTFNDNPYVIPMPIRPIHQQSIYTILGEYKATVDVFIQAYIFDWTDNALINAAMRAQLELIFQTPWIVGISFDDGVSYNYFKIITDSEFTIQQERYLKTELLFGQTGLEFVEIPGFDITDYEIDTF